MNKDPTFPLYCQRFLFAENLKGFLKSWNKLQLQEFDWRFLIISKLFQFYFLIIFRAPGCEKKDYEQKKLLATQAMRSKPMGEPRTPNSVWSGLGFSSSMPEAVIREKMAAEPEKVEVVTKLLTILQIDGPPRGRISEAFNLCLRRVRDWRGSAEWQTAVLEVCYNYQVRHFSFYFLGDILALWGWFWGDGFG